jgi:hypothetical protein
MSNAMYVLRILNSISSPVTAKRAKSLVDNANLMLLLLIVGSAKLVFYLGQLMLLEMVVWIAQRTA